MGSIIALIFIAIYFIVIKPAKHLSGEKSHTKTRLSASEKTRSKRSVQKYNEGILSLNTRSRTLQKIYIGGVKHTIYKCHLEGKSPIQIYLDPRLDSWRFSAGDTMNARNQKLNYISYIGSLMEEEGIIKKAKEDSNEDNIRLSKSLGFKPIGNVEPICPYCGYKFDKKPAKKKKCPDCENFIYIRTRKYDKQKVLVTEDQLNEISSEWGI